VARAFLTWKAEVEQLREENEKTPLGLVYEKDIEQLQIENDALHRAAEGVKGLNEELRGRIKELRGRRRCERRWQTVYPRNPDNEQRKGDRRAHAGNIDEWLPPALPKCERLYCEGCTGLTRLPSKLPACKSLDCSGCTGLNWSKLPV